MNVRFWPKAVIVSGELNLKEKNYIHRIIASGSTKNQTGDKIVSINQ